MDPQAAIQAALSKHVAADPSQLASYCLDVQDELNWVPQEALSAAAQHFGLSMAQVMDGVGFRSDIALEPQGRVVIKACQGLSCSQAGAAEVFKALCQSLRLADGETSADGSFTLRKAHCFGRCAMGPNVKIGHELHSTCDEAWARAKAKRLLGG